MNEIMQVTANSGLIIRSGEEQDIKYLVDFQKEHKLLLNKYLIVWLESEKDNG